MRSSVTGQPAGHWLAAFNFGFLRYDWDDPRVAAFVEALDAVNAVAARSPGFVWRMAEAEMEHAQVAEGGAFGGEPRVASTLSLWRDAESFAGFTLRSVHARFMLRAADWLETERSGLVLWWHPVEAAWPTVEEGLARYRRLQRRGPGAEAFSWAALCLDAGDFPHRVRAYLTADIE